MKYDVELNIDLSVSKVIELFDNFENLKKWQPGLIETIAISGNPGQKGAETKLIYDEKGRKVELIEKIITRNLPDEFSATYEAKGVMNWVYNYFTPLGPQKTKWRMKNEFQFKGLMSFMSLFMKKVFPKQTLKDMKRFKAWAESSE